ncbi:hypothetical protein ACFQ7G_07075 [Streptomyces massasporeus]
MDLDNRELSVDRGQDEEEALARMLIAAACPKVLVRTQIGTPLAKAALEDPDAFTFTRLLELSGVGVGRQEQVEVVVGLAASNA